MPPESRPRHKQRVFIDADVLFAGSAVPSEHGASLVVLRMAEITLLEAYTSQHVIEEAERNLRAKMLATLLAFQMIVSRCLRVVPNPQPEEIQSLVGVADPFDLPVLVAALKTECQYLVTFNTRHYVPGDPGISVLPPGDFQLRVRDLLASL